MVSFDCLVSPSSGPNTPRPTPVFLPFRGDAPARACSPEMVGFSPLAAQVSFSASQSKGGCVHAAKPWGFGAPSPPVRPPPGVGCGLTPRPAAPPREF